MNEQEQPDSGQPDERITELNSTPIIVDDNESLRKELSAIQELIKDQNEDWKVRMAALQRFQRLMDLEQIFSQFNNVEYGQTNFEPTQDNSLNAGNIVHLLQECKIPQALITQVEDRRSNLCKEACRAVTCLSKSFRSGFNFYVDELAPPLLKLLVITIKVIAESAHTCIESFATITYPTILPHIQNTSTQAHPVLKARGSEYLLQILEDKQIQSTKLEPYLNVIEDTLRRQLGDSAPVARATARKSFLAFKARWESRGESLFDSLEPSLQKIISTVDKSVKTKVTVAPKRTNFRAFLKNQTQNQDEDSSSSSPETSARSDSSSSDKSNNNNSPSESTSSEQQTSNTAPNQNSLQMNAGQSEILPSPSKRKIEAQTNHIIQDVIHPSPDHSSSSPQEEAARDLPINRELNFELSEPAKEQPDVVPLESTPTSEPTEAAGPIVSQLEAVQDTIAVDSAPVQMPETIQELPQNQPESTPSLPATTHQPSAPVSALKPLSDEVQPHKKRAVAIPSKVVAKSQPAVATRAVPTVSAVTARRTVTSVSTVSSSSKVTSIATSRVASVTAVRSQPIASARLSRPAVATKTAPVSTVRRVGIAKSKDSVANTVIETSHSEMGGVAVAVKVKENIPPATLTKAASLVAPSTKAASKAPTVASNRILKPVNGARPVDISVKKSNSEPIVKLRVISKPKTEVVSAPVPATKTSTVTTTTTKTTTSSAAPTAAPTAAPIRKLSHRLKKTSPTAVRILETKKRLQVVPSNSSELVAKKTVPVSKTEGTIAATSVRQFPVRTKPIVLSPRATKTKAK